MQNGFVWHTLAVATCRLLYNQSAGKHTEVFQMEFLIICSLLSYFATESGPLRNSNSKNVLLEILKKKKKEHLNDSHMFLAVGTHLLHLEQSILHTTDWIVWALPTIILCFLTLAKAIKSFTVTGRAALHDIKKVQNGAQTAVTHHTCKVFPTFFNLSLEKSTCTKVLLLQTTYSSW